MVYGSSSDGNDDGIAGDSVGSGEMWEDRVELVLVLLSNLYLSSNLSRLRKVDLVSLHFLSHFYFYFWFIFYFSILRT